MNEARIFNTNLTIQEIGNSAKAGGVGGGSPDPTDGRTAFIYLQYRNKVSGYMDGIRVQEAIWYFEEENTNRVPGSPLDDLIIKTLADMASAGWDVNYLGPVRVLNLVVSSDGASHQDLLALTTPVPEPASLLLLGSGLLSLAAVFGRRRKRA